MIVNIFLEIGVFLVFLLAILLFLFFRRVKVNQTLSQAITKDVPLSLQSLLEKIESKTATTQELKINLDLVLKNYGVIDDFSTYEKILVTITLHPNTNKNLILNFDKELSKRNPEYTKRISDSVTNALKIR